MIFITNAYIEPITASEIENGTILIDNGRIIALGKELVAPADAQIADELAKEPYPALVDPSFGNKTKPELSNKTYATAGVLHKAGVKICIITDAPVITIENLPMCAGFAARAGLPIEEAWKTITINPAKSWALLTV